MDHERHVKELNKLLSKHNEKTVKGPSSKQWLTKGKVILADLVDDKAILYAMHTNEEDTNTAYERLNKHNNKWHDSSKTLKQGLLDEQKHKKWIEKQLEE
ncbi:hypothetical protein RHORCCE3_0999 [Rickettsia hoogstraalii str. RCCE3]|nr:hypothetical protein RHORCCE3_0999 [Rickettsia hoogstraalii str. RCCE3]